MTISQLSLGKTALTNQPPNLVTDSNQSLLLLTA